MRRVLPVAIALIAYLLQANFLGSLRPLGVVPNLLLVVVVLVALSATASETLLVAVVGGLLLDLASGGDFGLRLAFYTTLALGGLVLQQLGIEPTNLPVVVGLVVTGTIIFNLAVLAPVLAAHGLIGWRVVVVRVALEAGLNLILVGLVGPPVVRLTRRQTSLLHVGAVR